MGFGVPSSDGSARGAAPGGLKAGLRAGGTTRGWRPDAAGHPPGSSVNLPGSGCRNERSWKSCKPSSVRPLRAVAIIYLSNRYPGSADLRRRGRAVQIPYLVLLPMRFSVPRHSHDGRWALTPPFHPYPRPCGRGRFVFCGTVCHAGLSSVVPAGMPAYPGLRPVLPVSSASRPVELGLSSRNLRSERSPALPRPLGP